MAWRIRVDLDGAPLLIPSKLGLSFEGGLQLGENVQVLDTKIRTNNTAWKDDFGKFSTVKDRYRELSLRLRENRPAPAESVDFEVLVRAYDDGVALRYVLPKQKSLGQFKLVDDRTEFLFPADHRAWIGGSTEAECNYQEIRLSQTPGDRRILPLVVQTPSALGRGGRGRCAGLVRLVSNISRQTRCLRCQGVVGFSRRIHHAPRVGLARVDHRTHCGRSDRFHPVD